MHTPLQALIWEVWRTSRLELFVRLGFLMILSILFYKGTGYLETRGPEADMIHGFFILFLSALSITSQNWILALDREQSGFSFRIGFIRPVPTWLLVAVPMFFTVVASLVCFLFSATLFSFLAGVNLPLQAHAAIVAFLVVCFMATTWSPTTQVGKGVAVGFLLACICLFVFACHARSGNADPILMWLTHQSHYAFSWKIYGLLFVGIVSAFSLTVLSVERQRHGDRLWFSTSSLWPRRRSVPMSMRRKLFQSPTSAQYWYELRRCGGPVFAIASAGTILVLIMVLIGRLIANQPESLPLIWLIALAVCPFVYQLVASDAAVGLRIRQGAISLSNFDATRPMTNDQLISIKLVAIGASSFFGWLAMGLLATVYTLLMGDGHHWLSLGQGILSWVGDVPFYWWIAGGCNLVLIFITNCSVLLTFGLWMPRHTKLFSAIAVLVYGHIMLAVWDAENGWVFRSLWSVYGFLLAFSILLLCGLTFKRAYDAGYLGKQLFGISFGLWLVYVATAVTTLWKILPAIPIPTAVIVLGASMLLVPLATTAAAPLALGTQRHT